MIIGIAEDTDDLREPMKLFWECGGHKVATARDGQEAFALALSLKPDLILMDLCMPIMNGFDAAPHIRQSPETSAIPIVGISGYLGDKVWCHRALAAGVNECVAKPVNSAALDDLLSPVLAATKPAMTFGKSVAIGTHVSRAPQEHIRIRSTLNKMWIWEHLTSDGHVVNSSPQFLSKEDCGADAVNQELPVIGLARKRRGKTAHAAKPSPVSVSPECVATLVKTTAGLWHWRIVSSNGEEVSRSKRYFLTLRDCERDVRSSAQPADEPLKVRVHS